MEIEDREEKMFQKQRYLFKGHKLVSQNTLDAVDAESDDGVL